MFSKTLFTVLFIAVSTACFSQTSTYHRYIIEFIDKENNPYSVTNPSEYLSQRAIDRRTRYNIAITSNDLPVTPDYVEQVRNTGVKLLNKSKWLNSISIETDDSLALLEIRAFPFVKSSAPIAPRVSGKRVSKQNESISIAGKASGDHAIDYGKSVDEINMISGNSLHLQGFRGEGMMIAVFDVGFFNAPNLAVFDTLFSDGRVLGWWNFVNGDDSVFYDGTHGTAVLSTIAANIPGVMVGTAPESSFYLFKSEDPGSEYPIEEHNWAAAAERSDSIGVDIISSSLGYSRFDDTTFNHSYSDMDGNTTMVTRAADFAASKGMIVCSSAGNEGTKDWYYITAPA
ncbi:MAG: S8 family serine peptidase, partial [Chitinophagales bacterium]|nr:S8 family serine peptidase [Chitinophagales bacterium]